MAGDGRSIDQRDPGTCRPQDDHDVRAVQSSLPGTQAFRDRSDRVGDMKVILGKASMEAQARHRHVMGSCHLKTKVVLDASFQRTGRENSLLPILDVALLVLTKPKFAASRIQRSQ